MEEGTVSESVPDLKDIEVKIGRKTPEGLLRWMREEASSYRGDAKLSTAQDGGKEPGVMSLDEKIRKLKVEMAHLRSVDVKILQQLLAVHEGIEAVKWLMEERSTLTSRCSSLTSSQYSLGDTSWRGSWSSLQDPNDRLDNISIGSYLDTLADDMDEYCPSSSESVITAGGRAGGVLGAAGPRSGSQAGISETGGGAKNGTEVKGGLETGTTCVIPVNVTTGAGSGVSEIPLSSPQKKPEAPKPDTCTKAAEAGKGNPVSKGNAQTQVVKSNGVLEKATKQTGGPTCPGLKDKLGTTQSPKLQPYTNGKIDMDTCKMNGKMHLEYDAHWRWVQSQEDVTFL